LAFSTSSCCATPVPSFPASPSPSPPPTPPTASQDRHQATAQNGSATQKATNIPPPIVEARVADARETNDATTEEGTEDARHTSLRPFPLHNRANDVQPFPTRAAPLHTRHRRILRYLSFGLFCRARKNRNAK
jgi:hypothetical protein